MKGMFQFYRIFLTSSGTLTGFLSFVMNTLVVFPLLKISRKEPEITGEELGGYLVQNLSWVIKYNVIKGFLNLSVSDVFYL